MCIETHHFLCIGSHCGCLVPFFFQEGLASVETPCLIGLTADVPQLVCGWASFSISKTGGVALRTVGLSVALVRGRGVGGVYGVVANGKTAK